MQFKPFETIDGDFSKGLVLICDHARNALPQEYGSLGLSSSQFERHIAFDIGAEALTKGLAARLDVPAVLARYSRLLIDPNRGRDDPTLVRQLSDGTIIPGNYPLDADELRSRIERFHKPYHDEIDRVLGKVLEERVIPAVLSVHTMTDQWNGVKRPWQIALLWDEDKRMANLFLKELENERESPELNVGLNQPYDGALVGDTMYSHCTQNGYAHLLLEVRQDLVSDTKGVNEWVDCLAELLERVNDNPHVHEIVHFGSRADLV